MGKKRQNNISIGLCVARTTLCHIFLSSRNMLSSSIVSCKTQIIPQLAAPLRKGEESCMSCSVKENKNHLKVLMSPPSPNPLYSTMLSSHFTVSQACLKQINSWEEQEPNVKSDASERSISLSWTMLILTTVPCQDWFHHILKGSFLVVRPHHGSYIFVTLQRKI